jgi:PhoPQ-activated pathogenicity-related protein
MVIDLLNIPRQVPHQIALYGRPSASIAPYTERGLIPLQDTKEARDLWRMVDPWSYRSALRMPKMIVLANNDPYWSTDALNLYWDDLPGPKYISYSPNAAHNMVEAAPDGRRALPLRALNNLAAFVRCHISGKPMPEVEWRHEEGADGTLRLVVSASPKPQDVVLWSATSPTRDFRTARWTASPLKPDHAGRVNAAVPRPERGFVAFYADVAYQVEDLPLRLCTQLRLAGAAGDP